MKPKSLSVWAATGMLLLSTAASAQVRQSGPAAGNVPDAVPQDCQATGSDAWGSAFGSVPTGVGYQPSNWNTSASPVKNAALSSMTTDGSRTALSQWSPQADGSWTDHSYPSASCPNGYCQHGYHQGGYCQNGYCGHGHHCVGAGCLSPGGIARCMATAAYPDAGWNPPVHLPVNRDAIWYGSYYPQAFYGSPGGGFVGGYPQVYQPTDTTQLGYYYAHVPTWQTRPGMIPPTPIPSHFHARVGTHYSGLHHGFHSYGPGFSGVVHPVGYMAQSGWQPSGTTSRPQIVRPQVAQNPAGNGGRLRLSSLTSLFD